MAEVIARCIQAKPARAPEPQAHGGKPRAEFPFAEERLSPGDKIVLDSDGVTEARNAEGEYFGRKRLREVVAAHASEPCQAIHEAIQAAVAAFIEGALQADDITVLVLEYGG